MASGASSGAASHNGSGVEGEQSIDDLLQRLGIEEDQLDDFVLDDEPAVPLEGMKWLALARVHTSNFFSP